MGTFNPASAFNINALTGGGGGGGGGIAGLSALGTLGGLLGGIDSGVGAGVGAGGGSSASVWNVGAGGIGGRARGLSRSGDNVFMGSTSAIDDEEVGGHGLGARGGGANGGSGGNGMSPQACLDRIFSSLHRLGTE